MSVYEVHVGSWRKKNSKRIVELRELAEPLVLYVKRMGFTPRRIPAGGRARVLSVVGLSGHRLYAPDEPLRHAG